MDVGLKKGNWGVTRHCTDIFLVATALDACLLNNKV